MPKVKAAISITLDPKCYAKVNEQKDSASKYINRLILDDMIDDLEQAKLPNTFFTITGRCKTPGPCRGTEHFSNEPHCVYCKGELE